VNQDVHGRRVVDRVVRAEDQGLGAADGAAVRGKAECVPAVLGVLLGPGGQHLPGADGVQLFDAVEQQDPDLAPPPIARCRVAGHRVVCHVVSGVVHGVKPDAMRP
jgi:hypothetical protein